jgi:hypothetical protein
MGRREDSGGVVGTYCRVIGLAALVSMAIASAAPSAQAECPNEAIRKAQTSEAFPLGTVHLPVCMALEMVTPPKKSGQETFRISAFSRDGDRALFVSKAALAGTEGLQFFGGDSYVAGRTGNGWVTAPTSPPVSAGISAGGNPPGAPYGFSPDLGNWVLFGATREQRLSGEARFFSGGLGGAFAPLSTLLAPIDDSGKAEIGLLIGSNFTTSGTAEDLSATAFPTTFTTTSYFPGDPRETGPDKNSYLAFRDSGAEPALQLLARDEAGKAWGGRCGSFLGGGGGLNQGAISPDGSRIFFTTRPAQPFDPEDVGHPEANPPCSTANPLRIMLRTGEGPEIAELLPGGPSEPGDDRYQAASRDGSKVFLTTPRKLAASDQDATAEACSSTVGFSKGCDLYLYDADLPEGSRLIQVSAGENVPTKHEAGKGADVLSGATAISPDGSHAYFAAQGILTADTNPEGKSALAGKPNLYLYERGSGQTSFIGTLAEGDKGGAWGAGQVLASGGAYLAPLIGGSEGGDGHTLFIRSTASLIADDQDAGKADLYRYDSSDESLLCVSCIPGEPDSEPFEAFAGSSEGSVGSNFAELGRWASEDGQTVAFATGVPLLPEDEDGAVNSYVWREGQLLRLPGEIIGEAQYYKLPTVSPQGEQVGFTTTEALLPVDGDSTRDAYVVRVNGGFPNPVPSSVCDPLTEEACQGPAAIAPAIGVPATPAFTGPGNETPVSCKKSQVKKRGKCVTRKPKARKRHRRAGGKQGGSQ